MTSVIAIDGPAASGKSTVAGLVADKLNIPYINTGNMFRAVAWYFTENNICFSSLSSEKLKLLLQRLDLKYIKNSSGGFELSIAGIQLNEQIRVPEVTKIVSEVAALKEVRLYLLDLQRAYAEDGLVVMEGRDIGSVVFPNAEYKFFVTASPLVRAERRLAQGNENVSGATLQSVADEIARRDELDSKREIAPLVQADDAELIDTSDMTINDVVERIISKVK